jgi:hypothetical protein
MVVNPEVAPYALLAAVPTLSRAAGWDACVSTSGGP